MTRVNIVIILEIITLLCCIGHMGAILNKYSAVDVIVLFVLTVLSFIGSLVIALWPKKIPFKIL